MNVLLIYSFIFIILFHIVFTQNVQFDFYTFDEAVKYINDVKYTQKDYDNIIIYLKNLLNNHYIYLDIAKKPPPPFKPVDVIKELKSIKTEKIN